MSDVYSIDAAVYAMPAPGAVARRIDSHGFEAASARWHWLGQRTINSLAQRGRAQAGDVAPRRTGGRRMSCSEIDAAVAVEAGHVLGSAVRGIRAPGATVAAQVVYGRRGLTPPKISPSERGVASSLAIRARRGDVEAAKAWDARLAHERAVGAVIRAALALVPAQPSTGRYRLPPQDDRLAEALQGLDPDAISAVFPDLPLIPSEPEPDVTPTPAAETTLAATEAASPASRGRLPDVEMLRDLHAKGLSCADVAGRYGVTATAVHSRWARLGLDTRGRCGGIPSRTPATAPLAETESAASPSETEAPAWTPGTDYADVTVVPGRPGERLSVEDLALAVDLMRARSMTPDAAIAVVRAEVASSRAAATKTTFNGMRKSAIRSWFSALADDRSLPSLDQE